MRKIAIFGGILAAAIRCQSAPVGNPGLPNNPEPPPWSSWSTNTMAGCQGRVQVLDKWCLAHNAPSQGAATESLVWLYYAPSIGIYGFDQGGWDWNISFVFEDRIALSHVDTSLYSCSVLLTNRVPEGVALEDFFETQQRQFINALSPRPLGDYCAVAYFGYYLGEGQIIRDPTSGEVLGVNHFAGGSLGVSNARTDGTNAILSIRADGGDAEIIFNPDMKPIGGLRGGKPVIVDPTNNTFFAEKAWGSPVKSFRLALTFDKTTFTNGEPITATVWAQNVTKDYQHYPTLAPGGQVVTVFDQNGKALPTLDSQRPRTFLNQLSNIRTIPYHVRVPPSAHQTILAPVTAQYDMSTPGQYTVRFSLKVPGPADQSWDTAVSQDVKIRVLPK